MKPKNFPERKRQRQLRALKRLKDQEAQCNHAVDFYGRPNRSWASLKQSISHLEDIVGQTSLRDVRIKKHRGQKRQKDANPIVKSF